MSFRLLSPLECVAQPARSLFSLLVLGAALAAAAPHGHAATYWVAPTGNDASPGTREKPWATPHKAVAAVQPGDVAIFRGGVYPLDRPVMPTTSGTPDAWITLMGYPGERPVFNGAAWKPKWRERTGHGLFSIEKASYMRLRNLHVRTSYRMGFAVFRPASHVELIECSSHDSFMPGIGLWNCEHVKVLHCEVIGANTNRLRLSGNPRDEAPHEAISSGGAKFFEIAYNHVYDCDKEGIDIKEVSAHGVVHHNYVHDLPRQGLYADAWFGTLENVEFRDNVVHDCEWGMAVSTEDEGSSLHNVRVHHNLFYRNRGSGVYFSTWGVAGPRDNVVIAHNTLYGNGSPDRFSGPTGNIDVRSPNVSNVSIYNNICAAGGTFEIGTFADPEKGGAAELAKRGIQITHNFIGAFRPIDPKIAATVRDGSKTHKQFGRSHAIPGEHPILGEPGFTDAAKGVFTLTERSPARGAGKWPEGTPAGIAAPDLGAFPFGFGENLDLEPEPEHVFENVWRIVQHTVPGKRFRRLESRDGGKTWTEASRDAVGNYVADIHYFTVEPGAKPPTFKYRAR